MIGDPTRISLERLKRARISVHTQDPGEDGLHEPTSPGYRRAPAPTYKDVENGIVSTSELRITPGVNVRAIGWWEGNEFLLGQKFPEAVLSGNTELVFDPGTISVYMYQVEG